MTIPKRASLIAVLVVTTGLNLVACSNGALPVTDPDMSELVGSWNLGRVAKG